MTDTSDSFARRGARTTPEAIAERTFSQVKRGFAEAEVRAYLRMVSNEFAGVVARERDLGAKVAQLEEQLRKPTLPPSDQDLIAALGEETARVLGQARESAVELRNKAEEHARRVVREAQETARELRATTQQAVEAKTREAEDSARARAKEILTEARALRDRVLADLEARRQELDQQVAELRGGRGKLVETYEVVERALAHAARVMAQEPSTPPDVPEPPEVAAPPDETDATNGAPAPVTSAPDTDDATTSDEPRADVGALFEKLRSDQEGAAASGAAVQSDAPGEPAAAAHDAGHDAAPEAAPEAVADDAAPEATPGVEDANPATAARDSALAAPADDLVRRGKRALQDEQNDLLDGLRRQRGKIDTSKVLPSLDDQVARWAHVLQPAIDAAYTGGSASVEGATVPDAAPRALLTDVSTSVVSPLRERLEASLEQVDARTPADLEIAVAQGLGARYREWRGEQLEDSLGDALAVAWSRGVFDAAPDGARLRWIPAVVGKCPDCDDNALEPTVKGSDFPTGQPHPPAHPGCRCLLVVDAG
jgi:DivIVA domain-containing protein